MRLVEIGETASGWKVAVLDGTVVFTSPTGKRTAWSKQTLADILRLMMQSPEFKVTGGDTRGPGQKGKPEPGHSPTRPSGPLERMAEMMKEWEE